MKYNSLKVIADIIQKQLLYETNGEIIKLDKYSGFKPQRFEDENGNTHLYLFKPAKSNEITNVFFGGSDLNINARINNYISTSDINLIGYSLGGPIAAKIAEDNPSIKNLSLILPPSSIKEVSAEQAMQVFKEVPVIGKAIASFFKKRPKLTKVYLVKILIQLPR